jgi:GNAT superfamily N-acetyltransferase
MHGDVRWRVTSGEQDPVTVERLLGLLPTWFGIPASNSGYVAAARTLPTYLAWPDRPGQAGQAASQPGGVLLASRHFPQSAEIHLMAVDPARHRQGAGRALVAALEADLIADGVEFLQVKTLGPSHPDSGYQLTRQFYLRVGFRPLEELHEVWGEENPCLIMVKALPDRS